MKTLKGWNRFTPLKSKILQDLIAAKTDERIASVAVRIFVLETAIRKMNHANGAFLDRELPVLRSVDELKLMRVRAIAKARGQK